MCALHGLTMAANFIDIGWTPGSQYIKIFLIFTEPGCCAADRVNFGPVVQCMSTEQRVLAACACGSCSLCGILCMWRYAVLLCNNCTDSRTVYVWTAKQQKRQYISGIAAKASLPLSSFSLSRDHALVSSGGSRICRWGEDEPKF